MWAKEVIILLCHHFIIPMMKFQSLLVFNHLPQQFFANLQCQIWLEKGGLTLAASILSIKRTKKCMPCGSWSDLKKLLKKI